MRDLHLASPVERGPDVETLQKKLHRLGYNPGPIDGRYGTATAGAVRAFQKAKKLRQDGIVGAKTRAALAKQVTPSQKAKPTPATKPSSKGLKALKLAAKYVGITESPRGSNKQQFGKWFGVNGVAWCAIFMSQCFLDGAGVLLGKGLPLSAGGYPKGVAYVPTLEAWLRSKGYWVGRSTPHPGDIAIFNWDGGVADHVGIVEAYLGGGKFSTIEGNTGVGNDSNGGEVMRRVRYVSQVNGFGRIA